MMYLQSTFTNFKPIVKIYFFCKYTTRLKHGVVYDRVAKKIYTTKKQGAAMATISAVCPRGTEHDRLPLSCFAPCGHTVKITAKVESKHDTRQSFGHGKGHKNTW
jgi:hypothetical protein